MSNASQTTATMSGWLVFAGTMLILAGFLQGIAGLVALFNPSLFLVTSTHLWLLDFTQWGWVHLLLGILLIVSGFSLFAGQLWGRLVAITVAMLSAIANFGFIWAYPIWSLVIIAIDIMVIYAAIRYDAAEAV